MDVQDFLPRILAAGFALEPDGADIIVRPFSKLSEPQKAFIRAHKPELIAALTGKTQAPTPGTDPPAPGTSHPSIGSELPPTGPAHEPPSPADLATVADWLDAIGESPEGTAATLDRCRADPEALAYFLALATRPATAQEAVRNPEPLPTSIPGLDRAPQAATGGQHVRCTDCQHQEPTQHPALVACKAGREALNPCWAFWKFDRRTCPSFVAITTTQGTTEAAGFDLGTSNNNTEGTGP